MGDSAPGSVDFTLESARQAREYMFGEDSLEL